MDRRNLSPETRAKIGDAMRGRRLTPEHRAKISSSLRESPLAQEHLRRLHEAGRGRPVTQETRARLSVSVKASRTPEVRARLSAVNTLTLEDYLARIEVEATTGCWFVRGVERRSPYRRIYEWTVGPVPDGMNLDHLCGMRTDGRVCCNPEHLEPATHSENLRRGGLPHFELRGLAHPWSECA